MEGEEEANLPAQSSNLVRPIHPDSNPTRPFAPSSSSASSSSSSPGFLRHVQAAFKRHRPLVTMQSNSIRPKRILVPQREASRTVASNLGFSIDDKSSKGVVSSSQGHDLKDSVALAKNTTCEAGENREDSVSNIITSPDEENYNPLDVHRNQSKPIKRSEEIPSSHVDFQHAQDKVQLSVARVDCTQGADGQMATEMDNLSSHLGSLALTEMEWEVSNHLDASSVVSQDMKKPRLNTESEGNVRSVGGISSQFSKRTPHVHDQLHQFGDFLHGDASHPMIQSSVVGSSGATSTLTHSTSAPMVSSTTYFSQSLPERSSRMPLESYGDFDANRQPITQGDVLQPSHPSSKYTSGVPVDPSESAAQDSSTVIDNQKEYCPSKEQHGCELKDSDMPKEPSPIDGKSNQEKGFDLTDIQSQAPFSRNSCTDVKLESSKSTKQEKAVSVKGTSAPRKRSYDPDLFFKVNGKFYQRLGKIGSGGSSEVHKVISSDCTIYALKKIKLKGRDYATAYGFCQEIEYLNKLKGRNYIIQLIDYEVTDKALLREVISGSLSNKDQRVKDDGYIYMVLEYGEIDLAHMLSQKWKELDGSGQAIDENWLRFYWQQILLAVNTIHEERIVHSDLKPANFLLVKGSLKLIDFGIAKAILSDTTNIQRDSQVGTLSYMSPEAFMCNENDPDGNIIKCGRPSDIWSLGCILYQMVYGRTPFSEYKTFWAKFKVITDRNHVIVYELVSNPWLLDLMKKCLAWDRSERWRIPQLLQHPFLVPPIPPPPPPHLPSTQDNQSYFKLLHLIAEACVNDQEASTLYYQLKKLLTDPPISTEVARPLLLTVASRDQCCELLSQISKCCCKLQQHLANLGNRMSSS